MTRPRSTMRRPLALVLVLACLPGAGLLALNRSDPELMVRRLSTAAIADGEPSEAAITIPGQPAAVPAPPSSRFTVIALRPLFTPGRRPPATPEASVAAPTDPSIPDVVVTGIVTAGEDSVAIIEPTNPGPQAESLVARVGHSIAGWKIESIEPDRVVLARDGERHEMMLIKEDDPRRASASQRRISPAQRRLAPQGTPARTPNPPRQAPAPNLPRQQTVVTQPQNR